MKLILSFKAVIIILSSTRQSALNPLISCHSQAMIQPHSNSLKRLDTTWLIRHNNIRMTSHVSIEAKHELKYFKTTVIQILV